MNNIILAITRLGKWLLNIPDDPKNRKYFLTISIASSLIFCIFLSMRIYNEYSSQSTIADVIGNSAIVDEIVAPNNSNITNDSENYGTIEFSTMVLMILSLVLLHVVYTLWIIIGLYLQPQKSKSRREQIHSM